jgi:hypothetical protein
MRDVIKGLKKSYIIVNDKAGEIGAKRRPKAIALGFAIHKQSGS